MARSDPDLFVVCKNCSEEVSPYVTECPYCGQRVRKRAPKLERGAPPVPKPSRRERAPRREPRPSRVGRPSLPRVSIRADGRPVATIGLVLASFAIYVVALTGAFNPSDVIVSQGVGDSSWRLLTAPFVHLDPGGSRIFAGGAYQFATMIAVGTFGWLLERRHGALAVLAVALTAGVAGMAAVALIDPTPVAAGANGMGLGLLCAWAVPDLRARRNGEEYEGDLLGTATIAVVLALMPAAVFFASAIAGITGAAIGLIAGLALSRR